MGHQRERAKLRFCKDTVRVIGIIFSLVLLGWIVHMGYKLTTETTEIESGDAEGCSLALVFGAITVGLGLIYFIIGLMIVAELALDVLAWLEKEGSINYKGNLYIHFQLSILRFAVMIKCVCICISYGLGRYLTVDGHLPIRALVTTSL